VPDSIEIFGDVVNSNIYRQIFGDSPDRPELLEFDLKLDILELYILDSLELRGREHSKISKKKIQYDTI
jgi:hypothetical protein